MPGCHKSCYVNYSFSALRHLPDHRSATVEQPSSYFIASHLLQKLGKISWLRSTPVLVRHTRELVPSTFYRCLNHSWCLALSWRGLLAIFNRLSMLRQLWSTPPVLAILTFSHVYCNEYCRHDQQVSHGRQYLNRINSLTTYQDPLHLSETISLAFLSRLHIIL